MVEIFTKESHIWHNEILQLCPFRSLKKTGIFLILFVCFTHIFFIPFSLPDIPLYCSDFFYLLFPLVLSLLQLIFLSFHFQFLFWLHYVLLTLLIFLLSLSFLFQRFSLFFICSSLFLFFLKPIFLLIIPYFSLSSSNFYSSPPIPTFSFLSLSFLRTQGVCLLPFREHQVFFSVSLLSNSSPYLIPSFMPSYLFLSLFFLLLLCLFVFFFFFLLFFFYTSLTFLNFIFFLHFLLFLFYYLSLSFSSLHLFSLTFSLFVLSLLLLFLFFFHASLYSYSFLLHFLFLFFLISSTFNSSTFSLPNSSSFFFFLLFSLIVCLFLVFHKC